MRQLAASPSQDLTVSHPNSNWELVPCRSSPTHSVGYQPSTIERHALGSANAYAQYIAAVRQA